MWFQRKRRALNAMAWVAAAAAIFTCACRAQAIGRQGANRVLWFPPSIDRWNSLHSPTVPKEMVASLRVAGFPITLEKTALEDARNRFGGTIGKRGDAGDFEAWLCLHGNGPNGPWVLWLTSGELDGPAISGFEWRHLSLNEIPDHRCLFLEGSSVIELPLPLHPGMTGAEARKVVGNPTVVRGETLIFFHEHDEVIDNLPYTADNIVSLVLRGGRVLAIEVQKTTVN
jgi:hypothetical protein